MARETAAYLIEMIGQDCRPASHVMRYHAPQRSSSLFVWTRRVEAFRPWLGNFATQSTKSPPLLPLILLVHLIPVDQGAMSDQANAYAHHLQTTVLPALEGVREVLSVLDADIKD